MITLYVLAAAFGIGVLWLGTTIRSSSSSNAGRLPVRPCAIRPPRAGTHDVDPIADRLEKVNMQIITMAVPSQDGITRDNVTVRVDAVIYSRSRIRCVGVDVQDYVSAIGEVAQT